METHGERFWSRVEKGSGDGCWLWVGARSRGYGQIKWGSRTHQAHRVSYAMAFGVPVTEVPLLDHRCHNADPTCAGGQACPHRACVRPDHLQPSSQRDNLLASPLTLAAQNAAKTHCPADHPYDEENTYVDGKGLRHCRECSRIRSREYQRRRRAAATLTP